MFRRLPWSLREGEGNAHIFNTLFHQGGGLVLGGLLEEVDLLAAQTRCLLFAAAHRGAGPDYGLCRSSRGEKKPSCKASSVHLCSPDNILHLTLLLMGTAMVTNVRSPESCSMDIGITLPVMKGEMSIWLHSLSAAAASQRVSSGQGSVQGCRLAVAFRRPSTFFL